MSKKVRLWKHYFFCLSAQESISARDQESSLNPTGTGVGRGMGKEVFMLILTGKNSCQTLRPFLELKTLETISHYISLYLELSLSMATMFFRKSLMRPMARYIITKEQYTNRPFNKYLLCFWYRKFNDSHSHWSVSRGIRFSWRLLFYLQPHLPVWRTVLLRFPLLFWRLSVYMSTVRGWSSW